ncbi:MAG TPA: ATP-binding cassette domain-containing protein [Verrucomicrobiae bacterium]|nr:ATP-binding cassette domain-containing protein [Verrucomicrobiae bacterium]
MKEKNLAISLTGVTKRFGSVTAVNDVSFEVDKGELFALLGPNGAGKSTTIKMLTTLLKPSSGTLTLAGHDVTKAQDAARKSFGIVFQDPSVDSEMTAYENMELHAALYGVRGSETRARIRTLLELVELWDRKDTLVKNYSGGMKRRLEIARGLLHHPHVLFLDEPTLGLDTQTRNLLWEYVKRLSHEEGMTVFFTTHYLEEAEAVANRIGIIDHGKLIALGTSKQLMKQTNTKTLEQAYLALTGKTVRDEEVGKGDEWRARRRARIMR